jgi:hypothetical protein
MAEEKNIQSKALAVKEEKGAERSRLLAAMFDVAWEAARQAEAVVKSSLSSNVDQGTQERVFQQEGEAAARKLREDAKKAYIESEIEEQAMLDEIEKEAREILTPNSIDPAAAIAAGALTEEQIVQTADSVAHAGDAASDTLLTLLSIAMEKDFDLAVHHIAEMNSEWETAVFDLSVCADSPSFDEDDIESRFEVMSPPESTPSGAAILEAAKSDLNVSASIRG